MTAFTWAVRGRHVSGISVQPAAFSPVFLPWSADPAFAGQSLPWADPEYPTLLILGIGFDYTASGTVATRRARLIVDQVGGGKIDWSASGTTTAGQANRYEFQQGVSLETTLVGSLLREGIGHGFLLLPGLVGSGEGQLTITASNGQAGDQLGAVSIRGLLLYP